MVQAACELGICAGMNVYVPLISIGTGYFKETASILAVNRIEWKDLSVIFNWIDMPECDSCDAWSNELSCTVGGHDFQELAPIISTVANVNCVASCFITKPSQWPYQLDVGIVDGALKVPDSRHSNKLVPRKQYWFCDCFQDYLLGGVGHGKRTPVEYGPFHVV